MPNSHYPLSHCCIDIEIRSCILIASGIERVKQLMISTLYLRGLLSLSYTGQNYFNLLIGLDRGYFPMIMRAVLLIKRA